MKTSRYLILSGIFLVLIFPNFALSQSSQTRKNPNAVETGNADKALKILLKPEPELTDEQKKQSEGMEEVAKLRVEFLDSGFIGAILPLNTLPFGLTETAIEAASKIQFEPERKNTKRVTVFQIIEYSFKREKVVVDAIDPENVAKAEAIIKQVIQKLGGQQYLQVTTQIGRGKFSQMRDSRNVSFQSFTDVIVYSDKEYTEFKERGIKSVQVNFGDDGWYFDGAVEKLDDQSKIQIDGFKRSMRVNIDNFLRGAWRGTGAQLSFVERRPSTLGKRNSVLKLRYSDGFAVEFEFSDEGFPMKSIYSRLGDDKRETVEEDQFAQFRDMQGIKTPFIIDHFSDGVRQSRVNFESVEFNKSVSNSIFSKPTNIKDLKKDLKL